MQSPPKYQRVCVNLHRDFNCDTPSILSLDDDCLCEIFGYLSLDDLVVLNQCCRRFNTVSKPLIKRKFSKINVDIKYYPSRILAKYGCVIETLTLHPAPRFIFAYCGYSKLQEIHQQCPKLRSITIKQLSPCVFSTPSFADFLEQITELDISVFCGTICGSRSEYSNEIIRTMSKCKNIVKLSLHKYLLDSFLYVEYPHLCDLSIKIGVHHFTPDIFTVFCQQNQNIRNIRLECASNQINISGILELKFLEKLYLHSCEENLNDSWMTQSLLPRISDITTLQSLEIEAKCDNLPSFKHLKQLSSLKFNLKSESERNGGFRWWRHDLSDLVELPDLKEFTLIHDKKSMLDLNDLIEIICDCSSLRTFIVSGFRHYDWGDQSIQMKFLNAFNSEGIELESSTDYWWKINNETNILNVIKNLSTS